jgi:hypothetical protein
MLGANIKKFGRQGDLASGMHASERLSILNRLKYSYAPNLSPSGLPRESLSFLNRSRNSTTSISFLKIGHPTKVDPLSLPAQ